MTLMLSKLFDAAIRVSNPWSLTALGIACVCLVVYLLVTKRFGKMARIVGIVAIVAIVVLVITSIYHSKIDIYRVRITVVGQQGTPVEDAKVWSSLGGEPKKVEGGWEFDIPAVLRPLDGRLTVWASVDTAYLYGSTELQLDTDYSPAGRIQLGRDQTARVRGLIIDRSNHAIPSAHVSVAGYESDTVVTDNGGNFELPAHAARDQKVLLHVEAKGYAGVTQWHPAGDEPATIILDRK
jgi:hypothetical protein